jgi:hypothetical protein
VNEISDTIVDIIMNKYSNESSGNAATVESFVEENPIASNDEEEISRDENQEIGW